ncbi:MAG TPA: hypothetical protein VIJ60_03870, partial [Acidimicrobiales bacterium]
DQIAGGSGADQIYAGSGNDIIRANDGFNVDLTHPLSEIIAENLTALIVTHDPSSTDAPDSDPLYPTSDQIYGGPGHDIVFLDHGNVDQSNNAITGTQGVEDAYTTDPAAFGLSDYFGGYDSSAVVLAGSGAQRITVNHTTQANVIVKNGYVYFSQPDGWLTHLSKVGSTNPGAGGNDAITLGDGNDIVVAGTGFDTITGGNGNKIILGDDGEITWSGGVLTEVISQDPGVSLDSTYANQITLGNGNNVVFGGSGENTISVGTGTDLIVGANGELNYSGGKPVQLETIFPTDAGRDTITTTGAQGVIVVGGGQGQVKTNQSSHYLVNDSNGAAAYNTATGWVQTAPATSGGGSGTGGTGGT